MAREFKISIVSPDRTVVDELAVSVIAPGIQGYLGILAGHEPLITELATGIITYRRPDNSDENVAVSEGCLEVSEGQVIVLAVTAERASDIDIARAETAADRARDRLLGREPGTDLTRANLSLVRAINRLRVVGGRR